MPGKEMSKDFTYIKMKLARSGVSNSSVFTMSLSNYTNNSTVYQIAGKTIYDPDLFSTDKLSQVLLEVESLAVGASGMNVQLYDGTNLTQIGLINFTTGESNTIKTSDFKSYFLTITTKIIIELNFAKAASAGASANLGAGNLVLKGK